MESELMIMRMWKLALKIIRLRILYWLHLNQLYSFFLGIFYCYSFPYHYAKRILATCLLQV